MFIPFVTLLLAVNAFALPQLVFLDEQQMHNLTVWGEDLYELIYKNDFKVNEGQWLGMLDAIATLDATEYLHYDLVKENDFKVNGQQWNQLINEIRQIVVDIDGENITINANLALLEKLQNDTLVEVEAFHHAVATEASAASVQRDLILQTGNIQVDAINNLNKLTTTCCASNSALLATVVSRLNSVVEAVGTSGDDIVSAVRIGNTVLERLEKITDIMSDIVNSMSTVLTAVQTVVEGIQQTSLSAIKGSNENIVLNTDKTNGLLEKLVEGGLTKQILETIAETEWNVDSEFMNVVSMDMAACECEPFCDGPFACEEVAHVEVEMLGVNIEPLAFASEPKRSKSPNSEHV